MDNVKTTSDSQFFMATYEPDGWGRRTDVIMNVKTLEEAIEKAKATIKSRQAYTQVLLLEVYENLYTRNSVLFDKPPRKENE